LKSSKQALRAATAAVFVRREDRAGRRLEKNKEESEDLPRPLSYGCRFRGEPVVRNDFRM